MVLNNVKFYHVKFNKKFEEEGIEFYSLEASTQRRRIELEDKAKVVGRRIGGGNPCALAVLPRSI